MAGEIVDVHKASGGTYGATRVRAELIHGRGIHVGHNAVELIMRRLVGRTDLPIPAWLFSWGVAVVLGGVSAS